MALINPDTLYTGGAVRFDSSPSVNLYAQLQQRQQAREAAKQEAFDTYIRGLNTKINPAGKRTVDDPAFQHFYKRWQDFGMQNKTALQKGDVPTQSEFNARYQDLLNLIQESKQAEDYKKPLVDILVDPNKRAQLSERVMPAIASHDEPLYIQDKSGEYIRNPNRRQLDFTSTLFNPQLDYAKQYEKWSKGYKMDEAAGDILRRDPITGTAIREYTSSFSPETKKQIAINAMNDVSADHKVGDYYQYRFEKLSDREFEELNKLYQQSFGKKNNLGGGIEVENYIDSPQKLAAAEALREASVTQKKEKEILDRQLAFQRAQTNIYLNRTGKDNQDLTLADYDIFKKFEKKYETKDVQIGKPDWLGRTPKKSATIIRASEVDVSDKKLIGDTKPYIDKDGTQFYIVREDGDWEGRNGQVISRANAARKNMDATSINEVKRGRLSGDIVPKPPVKPKPKNDPLGLLD